MDAWAPCSGGQCALSHRREPAIIQGVGDAIGGGPCHGSGSGAAANASIKCEPRVRGTGSAAKRLLTRQMTPSWSSRGLNRMEHGGNRLNQSGKTGPMQQSADHKDASEHWLVRKARYIGALTSSSATPRSCNLEDRSGSQRTVIATRPAPGPPTAMNTRPAADSHNCRGQSWLDCYR